MTTASILLIDDNPGVLSAGKLLLKRHFTHVETSRDPETLPDLLRDASFDVILLDMNFNRSRNTGEQGLYWLSQIKKIRPETVVVLITAFGDVSLAVQSIRAGAMDFVLKPWDNDKLLATIRTALELKTVKEENDQLRIKQTGRNLAQGRDLPPLIWQSIAMQQVMTTVSRVAETDANVLILGENGTGKDLIAQAIHAQSNRASENYVKVDLGALSDTLFESELFGHVKGAFTDAKEDRPGRFEAANGGVIFLDEIGNLPLPQQSKLLTVLQNRVVVRVGSNQARTVDVRVIAATNQDLYQMVQQRAFRQDLLYRINTIEIRLPALRERVEDIEPLATHFLQEFAQKYQRPTRHYKPALLEAMRRYHWPGNVRELRHAVERAVIMSNAATLDVEDMLLRDVNPTHASTPSTLNIEETERHLVEQALQKHHGNITEAARELGLTRGALYRRLEKYNL